MSGRGRPKRNLMKVSATDQRSAKARNAVLELFVSPKGVRIVEPNESVTPRSMQSEHSKDEAYLAGRNGKMKAVDATPVAAQAIAGGSGSGIAQKQAMTPSNNGTVPCSSGTVENNKCAEPGKKRKTQTWANVVGRNKLAMKGMNLQFIAPIIQNGEKIVKLDLEDVEQENEKWSSVIVLYVIGDSPTIGAMERFLSSLGKFLVKPQIYYHNDDYFVIRFSNVEERDQVLYSGPHTVNNRPIIMKAWSADFNLHDEILKTIPLWVRFPNLPLNCWSMKALSKLGSALRNRVYADECTTEAMRISYARMLIEMDVTKPLPRTMKLQDPKGKIIQQEITYDWEPAFYAKCLKIGHDCNETRGPQPQKKIYD
ncbi:uncharacterized protein LOC107826912 [Nicotiana tabacum]|uniref:Uncharacterized protein LOC107826912 n=1 Tax=Nicotiana tabacum TaxID=4097 RepID=A0AC58S9S4_TOBAC